MRKLMAIGAAAVPGYLYWRHVRLQNAQAAALEAETKLLAAMESDAPKEELVQLMKEAAIAYGAAAAEWQFMERTKTVGMLAIPATGLAALVLFANR
jgi:hypothetical protein